MQGVEVCSGQNVAAPQYCFACVPERCFTALAVRFSLCSGNSDPSESVSNRIRHHKAAVATCRSFRSQAGAAATHWRAVLKIRIPGYGFTALDGHLWSTTLPRR